MYKFLAVIMVSLVLSGCSFFKTSTSKKSTLIAEKISFENEVDFEEIASNIDSAIVGICGEYSDGDSIGSGVCVSKNGYILTNSHCVADSKSIKLYLADKSVAVAKIIYDNPVSDLAIIKSSVQIPYLEIGSSDDLNVGQDVLAVGTPLSLTLAHSFTKGIVSALNRTLKVGGENGEGYMQNLIQHDASLNPGNSGGPLINKKGQVVGINTLKITSGEGVGFAIPSKSFESLLNSYVDDVNYSLPKLGVYGFDGEIANYYNATNISGGFYVIDVLENGPLGSCGIKPTSVITTFNGKQIFNTLDLQDELYRLTANDTVYVEYVFEGQKYTIKTKLK